MFKNLFHKKEEKKTSYTKEQEKALNDSYNLMKKLLENNEKGLTK